MKFSKGRGSKSHKMYPPVQQGYQLTDHGWFYILEPEEMVNKLENPSFERGDINPGAGAEYAPIVFGSTTLSAVNTVSRRGAWSLEVTPASPPSDPMGLAVYPGFIPPGVGGIWTFSLDILGNPGHTYELFAPRASGAIAATSGEFVSNGLWQRPYITFQYDLGGGDIVSTVYLYRRSPALDETPFYVDGVMATEGTGKSTYFDGDTLPFGDDSNYVWIGKPHASYSKREASELSTGVIRRLSDYNFDLLGYEGLGSISQEKLLIQNALVGGASFQRGVDTVREYSIIGAIPARDHYQFMKNRKDILDLMEYSITVQQPMIIYCQMLDNCGDPISDPLMLPSLYSGGMEGNVTNLYQERVSMQFVMPRPQLMVDGEEGGDVDTRQGVDVNYITRRVPGSPGWDDWDTGANNSVAVCRFDPTQGRVYVGGNYTQIGSVPLAANRISYWDISGEYWAALNAQYPNSWVYTVEIAPNSDVYIGGSFTFIGAAGIQYIAYYDFDSNAWGGVGLGLTRPCYDLKFGPNGYLLYAVGYDGGGGYLVEFNLKTGATNTLGTVAAGQTVVGVEVDQDGKVYVVGAFTTIGGTSANGIAMYDPDTSSWSALGSGLDAGGIPGAGSGILYGDDGNMYVIGAFSSADGVTCGSIIGYNGDSFFALGRGLGLSAISTVPWHMAWRNGILYVPHINTSAGFIAATGVGGNTTAKYLATWDGSNWSSLDIVLDGSACTIDLDNEGIIYVGTRSFNGTGQAGESSLVNNTGTSIAWPVFVLEGDKDQVETWDDKLVWIRNETTKQTIYLNIDVNEDEVITIDCRPGRKKISSNLRGNLNNKLWPSSDFANFHIAPGYNYITVFIDNLELPMHVYWQIAHDYIDGAIYD